MRSFPHRFLVVGLLFLLFGGALAMLMRWQLGFGGAFGPALYAELLTVHSLTMIFWALTPLLFGALGNAVVPALVGAAQPAAPRLVSWSFAFYAFSGLQLVASLFLPHGTLATGWTAYAPLSTQRPSELGGTAVIAAIFFLALSTLLTAVNLAATVAFRRAPGMTWLRLPLSAWGFFLASLLNVLFMPVLMVAAAMLFCDRSLSTGFFAPEGDPLLYQHLFWIFGHPEVYILILPVWGLVSDLLAFFSRKPAWSYRTTVYSLVAITVLSTVVYGHHMYQAGLAPMLGRAFVLLTLLISLPAMLLVFNWLSTLRRGALRLDAPMRYALAAALVFGFGGITGLSLASMRENVWLHDTLYVVGHFHLTLAGTVLLGLFAALHYWFPKLYPGRALDERLGRIHVALTLVLFLAVFGGMLLAGWQGQPRRLFDTSQYVAWLNRGTTLCAWALGLAQLVFVASFLRAFRGAARGEANPWQVGTLEWMPGEPVVRGPHELSNPELMARLGRDWAGQAEP